jgi:carboxymethylenebutenolidase
MLRTAIDSAASPHLVLPRVTARLYFGHAVNDRSMSPDAIAKFEKALATWGGSYESETYDGALHGWMIPGRRMYHAAHAERGFAKLMQLLADSLPVPAAG